jgi:tetratricopeptide (TPR) repeat protein
MVHKLLIFSVLIGLVACMACKSKPDFSKQLEGLEKRLAAQYTHDRSDSLVNLYREAIKAHPDEHALNLKYFTRAAEVQFTKRHDGVSAVRWIADAVQNQGKGQDLSETMGLLARIWNANKYNTASTVKMDPKDIDKMQDLLTANLMWVDSALVRMDQQILSANGMPDKNLMTQYVETAEGYATLIRDRDKYGSVLLAAANMAKANEQYNKAVQLYSRIATKIPESAKARTALFMQAVVYESDLNDVEKARKTYQEFLSLYSTDTAYADDVRIALQQLGKTPDEVVEEFQKHPK